MHLSWSNKCLKLKLKVWLIWFKLVWLDVCKVILISILLWLKKKNLKGVHDCWWLFVWLWPKLFPIFQLFFKLDSPKSAHYNEVHENNFIQLQQNKHTRQRFKKPFKNIWSFFTFLRKYLLLQCFFSEAVFNA